MNPQPLADWRKLHGDAFQGARVLVTGGAGFIGSHLSEALVALGASVVVLDNLAGGSKDNVAPFKLDFVEGSVTDPATVARCVEGCRYVFHQAALGSVPGSVDRPRDYHDANGTGTLNVLEAAR